jgi:ABC-type amino acid transport substrate-binding protein
MIGGCRSSQQAEKRTTPYVVAFPSSWSHISLYGTEQSVVGFSSDLLTEIARTVNVKIQLVEADPDTMTALLDTGQVDGILTALPDDTMNERYFEFTLPYFVSGTVVVVAANSPYTKLDDLKSVIIAYDYGAGVSSTVGAKSTWMLKPYESVSRALDDVVAGGVDGMVLNYINASRLHRSLYRSRIRILAPPLATQQVRLAVRRGKNHELIELFNKGVVKYIQSGQYKELLDYWGIDSQLPMKEKKSQS